MALSFLFYTSPVPFHENHHLKGTYNQKGMGVSGLALMLLLWFQLFPSNQPTVCSCVKPELQILKTCARSVKKPLD